MINAGHASSVLLILHIHVYDFVGNQICQVLKIWLLRRIRRWTNL